MWNRKLGRTADHRESDASQYGYQPDPERQN